MSGFDLEYYNKETGEVLYVKRHVDGTYSYYDKVTGQAKKTSKRSLRSDYRCDKNASREAIKRKTRILGLRKSA